MKARCSGEILGCILYIGLVKFYIAVEFQTRGMQYTHYSRSFTVVFLMLCGVAGMLFGIIT